jgi:hypothetical protein
MFPVRHNLCHQGLVYENLRGDALLFGRQVPTFQESVLPSHNYSQEKHKSPTKKGVDVCYESFAIVKREASCLHSHFVHNRKQSKNNVIRVTCY